MDAIYLAFSTLIEIVDLNKNNYLEINHLFQFQITEWTIDVQTLLVCQALLVYLQVDILCQSTQKCVPSWQYLIVCNDIF